MQSIVPVPIASTIRPVIPKATGPLPVFRRGGPISPSQLSGPIPATPSEAELTAELTPKVSPKPKPKLQPVQSTQPASVIEVDDRTPVDRQALRDRSCSVWTTDRTYQLPSFVLDWETSVISVDFHQVLDIHRVNNRLAIRLQGIKEYHKKTETQFRG